jgi:hypothetical protein
LAIGFGINRLAKKRLKGAFCCDFIGSPYSFALRWVVYILVCCDFCVFSRWKNILYIMRKLISLCIFAATSVFSASAINLQQVRFHDEATDTTRINDILVEAYGERPSSLGDAVVLIGKKFLGTKYVGGTLEGGESEMLTVNLDELDCTTFVEMVSAMAITIDEHRTSWRDFVYNLERVRYRDGEMNGYVSRLHYICDWVMNNSHRGIVEDATLKFPAYTYAVKSIDFMSSNRDKYAALADSATYEGIKAVESNYRNHRYPYVKSIDLDKKGIYTCFRDGDIVAITSNLKNLDVTHLGIIVMENGEPHLLHASSAAGEVVVSKESLALYMKRNRAATGVRVIRLKN